MEAQFPSGLLGCRRLAEPQQDDGHDDAQHERQTYRPLAFVGFEGKENSQQNREDERDAHSDHEVLEPLRGIDAAGFGREGLVEVNGAEFVGQRMGQFFVGAYGLPPSGADKKEEKRREKTAQVKVEFANEFHGAHKREGLDLLEFLSRGFWSNYSSAGM